MIEMGDDYIPIRGCAYNAGKKIYFFTIYYVILKYYTPPTPTTLSRMCIISAIKVNFSTGGGCDTVGVFAVLSNYAHDNVYYYHIYRIKLLSSTALCTIRVP